MIDFGFITSWGPLRGFERRGFLEVWCAWPGCRPTTITDPAREGYKQPQACNYQKPGIPQRLWWDLHTRYSQTWRSLCEF